MSKKSRSTRRDFLVGRAALDALAELPERILPEEPGAVSLRPADEPTYLLQIARTAMACQFQVFLNADQSSDATEVALDALDRVEEIEDQLTVYRPQSEVSRLNVLAAARSVEVEQGLFHLLDASVLLCNETAGAFDITAGPLGKTWGFHRRQGKMPTPQSIAAALELVGSGWIQLDAERLSVAYKREGLEINLGAIGKGYALDRAADVLLEQGVEDFLLHGGQSSVFAHGTRRGRKSEVGWRVAIRHPLRHEIRLAEVTLRDRALGTSGSGNQFFHFNGKRYGHVIDPRTGYPAAGILSATVLAPNAMLGDALATAFFVMGVEAAQEYCARRPELGVILVSPGDQAGSLVLHSWGLEDDEWVRLVD